MNTLFTTLQVRAAKLGYSLVRKGSRFYLHGKSLSVHANSLDVIEKLLAQREGTTA